VLALVAATLAAGCRQDMQDQPKYKGQRGSHFFADGRSDRPLVQGVVARGHADDDTLRATGKSDGQLATRFPAPVTRATLLRGQERFNIYCSPCHDRVGDGNGMIVQRGYRHPPSLHIDRLRDAPVGHFFDVISNGYGAMPDYAAQVPVDDRWAIIAYIRALQLSQHASTGDVPPDELQKLAATAPEAAGTAPSQPTSQPSPLPRGAEGTPKR